MRSQEIELRALVEGYVGMCPAALQQDKWSTQSPEHALVRPLGHLLGMIGGWAPKWGSC